MLTIAFACSLFHQISEQPALNGLDPIELIQGRETQGKSEFSIRYLRYTYNFCSQENRELFQSNKLGFSIQNGGACGSMGPLSGKGDSTRFAVHNGKIFIFASESCRANFLKEPDAYAAPIPLINIPNGSTKESGVAAWIAARKAHSIPNEPLKSLIWESDQPYESGGEKKIWRERYSLNGIADFFTHQFTVGTKGYLAGASASSSWELENEKQFELHPAELRALRAQFMRHPYALLTVPMPCVKAGQMGQNGSTSNFLVNIKGIETLVRLSDKNQIASIEFIEYSGGKPLKTVRIVTEYTSIEGVVLPTKWTNAFEKNGILVPGPEVEYRTRFGEAPYVPRVWVPEHFDFVTPDVPQLN